MNNGSSTRTRTKYVYKQLTFRSCSKITVQLFVFGSVTISDFQKRIFIDFRYRASYTCNLATTTGYYKSIKRSLITDKTARVLSRFIISIVYSYSYCHKNRSLFLHHKKRYTNDSTRSRITCTTPTSPEDCACTLLHDRSVDFSVRR